VSRGSMRRAGEIKVRVPAGDDQREGRFISREGASLGG